METQEDVSYKTLTEALRTYAVDDLKRLASLIDAGKKPTRKEDLVQLIASSLKGGGLHAVWDRLSSLQKSAVAETVHSSGCRYDGERFAAKYGREPEWGNGPKLGLLYGGSLDRGFSLLHLFFIGGEMPLEIKARLKTIVPPPPPVTLKSTESIPETSEYRIREFDPSTRKFYMEVTNVPTRIHENEYAAQDDLMSVLRLVDAGKLSVTDKTRQPTKSTTEIIGKALQGGDYYSEPLTINDEEVDLTAIGPIKSFAWLMLLQASELVTMSGKRLALTAAGKKALGERAPAVLRSLWKKWRDSSLLDECRRIDIVKGQTGRGSHGFTSLPKRRRPIYDALADCPVGEWVNAYDFLRYMKAAGYDLSITRSPYNLYIAESYYGSLESDDLLIDRYVLCVLMEYASTLGIVDVAAIPPQFGKNDYTELWGTDDAEFFSRYDGLAYFRLTALGAYCLDKNRDYKPAAPKSGTLLTVENDLTIHTSGASIKPVDGTMLDVWMERTGPSSWRFDTEKLFGHIESGRELATLREFLTSSCAQGLPDEAAAYLDDIEERASLLSDEGPARLIECRSAALANAIAQDTLTKRLCKLAGERHLAVPEKSEAAFRRALHKLGYVLPLVATKRAVEAKEPTAAAPGEIGLHTVGEK